MMSVRSHSHVNPSPWTRRQFLAALGATGALAACSDSGQSDVDAGGEAVSKPSGPACEFTPPESDLSVFQVFGGPVFAANTPIRAPFLLGDAEGPLPTDLAPTEVEVTVYGKDGCMAGSPSTLTLHAEGLPRGYYPLEFAGGPAGFYDYVIDTGDTKVSSQFQIFDTSEVKLISPGDAMPVVETATFADPAGIDPVCTRDPVCSLHEESLTAPLGRGQKTVLLVSTPAFCQIGVCGPILDVLVDHAGDYPDLAFIHAEVYRKPQLSQQEYAPIISALGLNHEPSLYTIDENGAVVDRLDFIFDRAELLAKVERLVV